MAPNMSAGSEYSINSSLSQYNTAHSGEAGTRRFTREAATQNLGSEPINGSQYYYNGPKGKTNLALEFFGLFHKDPNAPTIISKYVAKNSTVSNVDTEVPGTAPRSIAPTPTVNAEG